VIHGWTVPPGVRWRAWEGEVVAFHPGSGDTHLLAPIAGALLEAVASGITSKEALLRHVAHHLDLPSDDALAAIVEEALATLVRRGLLSEDPL